MILALAAGVSLKRASKVDRLFAANILTGRQFREFVVADRLSQAEAFAMEPRLIATHRREIEGGTLWNVLAGGDGFQGILRADWQLISRQAVVTKKLSRSGLRAGAKAAATKALTGWGLRAGAKAVATKALSGSGLRAGAKAAATRLQRLQRLQPER